MIKRVLGGADQVAEHHREGPGVLLGILAQSGLDMIDARQFRGIVLLPPADFVGLVQDVFRESAEVLAEP
ncbi:MAG: hypothetical protein EOL89_14760 [Actinobacteria bacterium]|nr:hypothetical protein [Actinomycetota bacterium]